MHREISHTHSAFQPQSSWKLYTFTAMLGLLLFADIGPAIVAWLTAGSLDLPPWPREFFGQRFALIAAVVGGARVLYGSLDSLLEGRMGADLALALACIAAILIGEPLVAAEVVFIGLVGECLESFTFDRTQRAIRRLVEVFPRRCWLLRDGQEVRVLTEELKVGDVVVVKPGARIPVDGLVREGRSAVDQSPLTGESLPLDKGPGDRVLAGSVNQFGALVIEAERVAEQTVAGRVVELTSKALQDKAPLERTADRLSRYFLPIVLALAAVTFAVGLGWRWATLRPELGRFGWPEVVRSVYPALSVLVVACPCALILATPAAILAALGRLAGTGVLIKGGSALERLAQVDTVAFDKTGTLTEGRLELGDICSLGDTTTDDLLRLAARVEQRSEHPLGRLFVEAAGSRGWRLDEIEQFQAHPGAGVSARVDGKRVVVGTRRLLIEAGIDATPEVEGLLERLDATGQTALLVAQEGRVLGAIGARDRLRPEATGVLQELRSLGIIDIAMLTGDRSAVAQSIAAELGETKAEAELLPEAKSAFVNSWRQQGKRVAMVGDGINDAPALAAADVGLALGRTGTDLAAEAGEIVLMGEPLRSLPLLFRLSRETVRIIRQNILVFAIGVNIVGVVLTAWLWPMLAPNAKWYEQGPLAAVLYHQFGSLAVLLNSMRLLWFERARPVPGLRRLQSELSAVDGWIARHLDLDEGMHWIGDHAKPVAGAAAILVVLLYFGSGFNAIGPDEVGVVQRFGRLTDADLEPGLHWNWPWPIETVTRVQPLRVREIEIGFRSIPDGEKAARSLGWSSAHGGDGLRRLSDEAVMMTGDGNLVELQATLRFTISSPRAYLLGARDPEAALRTAAEAALRETVAGEQFLDLLTVNRSRFQEQVLARLQARCRSLGFDALGVELGSLSLQDVHPPQEVVEAYHDVAKAMEARDRMVNEAQADAIRKRRGAESIAMQTIRQAQAAAYERTRQAETARDTFLYRLRARSRLPWSEELRLLLAVLNSPEARAEPNRAYEIYARAREERLANQAFVADFRLVFDAVGQVLSGRDKILVDTDKLPGRRQLFLFDPELLRPLAPIALPGERAPRSTRGEPREEGP